MSYTNTPNSTQHTSQDDTSKMLTKTSENLKVNQLKKPVEELIWENRILRTVIKELEIANTEAGAEKRLTKTRISIFEKLEASYFLHLTDAQSKLRKAWMAKGTEIMQNRLNLDASGAGIHRDVYECSIKSWRDSYTRRDDMEIIISLLVMAHQTADITVGMLSVATEKVTALESEITGHKKRLKVQNNVVASIQKREKILLAEMKSSHEKELKEQKDIIASLKEKERIFAAETKIKYEKMLEAQCELIANPEEKEESTIPHANSKYEEKLKEQSSIIAKLEEEKIASAAKMGGVLRELAAHSEVSISILNRKRELMKPYESRNEHVIETGNISAHGGTCLADVFRIKSNADVDDTQWFKERYGVSVDTVERFGESSAFAKLVNMRYEMCNCGPGQRKTFFEFETEFQDLLIGDLEKDSKITTEAIDAFLLKNKKGKETFQKLCCIWDTATARQRKRRESKDLIKRSFFGGSIKSNSSHWTGQTWRRSKLDNMEEYGKDILSSAKYAMPWVKRRDPR